ncbi:hypothetical protein OSB04_024891 [Centaurea solstitialis]|uniref:Reverse transcriptase zinc-binding domain-containing protein n=1 Tax=Centaurea solstitialis TaxID=347529 RepID=A0AA38SNM9_9ASTR|nr:hypothetical protein OSB04_024891 [Centaurea solstitialis]
MSIIPLWVVYGIHNGYRKPAISLAKKTLPGIWFRIIKAIPELVDIGIDLSSSLKSRLDPGGGKLSFVGLEKTPRSPMKITELGLLFNLVNLTAVSGSEDKWRSKLSGDSDNSGFKSHDLIAYRPSQNQLFRLESMIPSAVNLARRGINVGNTSCALCNIRTDEVDHFLQGCQKMTQPANPTRTQPNSSRMG